MLAWLRAHPLTGYFGLTYALSWLVGLPAILDTWGIPNALSGLFALKQWVGPAIAAMVMTAILAGSAGLRSFRRDWSWSRGGVGWRWYLVVLVGAPALILVAVLAVAGIPSGPVPVGVATLPAYLGYFALVFVGVGLPEEIGWRGFALPRLQERFGPLPGTLVLGLLWALWHLPFFLTADHGGGPGTDLGAVALTFAIFTGLVMAMAVVFTYVFNRTRGSILLAGLLHAAIDTPQLVWLPLLLPVGAQNSAAGERALDLALLVAFGLVGLVLVIASRGRLGAGAAARATG